MTGGGHRSIAIRIDEGRLSTNGHRQHGDRSDGNVGSDRSLRRFTVLCADRIVGGQQDRWVEPEADYGEGSRSDAGFPPMPAWFKDNRDFGKIAAGLRATGLSETEVDGIMGENWLRVYERVWEQ